MRPPLERALGQQPPSARAGIGAIVAALTVSCVSVAIDAADCEITCVASCPIGFECAYGYCVRDPGSAVCPAPDGLNAAAGGTEPPIASLPDSGAAPSRSPAEVCSSSDGLRLSECPPPAPCRGVPYAITLSASGGVEPYVWSASVLPAGMRLSSRGELSGTLQAAATVAFSVRDSSGPGADGERSYTFELVPRDRCWFARAGNDTGTSYVELLDPLLDTGPSPRVRLPAGPGEEVADFRFSPDGRVLAVRTRDAMGTHRLALYGAPRWLALEPTRTEGRSVLQYAWATDSSLLALAVSDGAATYLETLRLTGSGAVGDAAALLPSTRVGPAVEAPVGSELVWLSGSRLAFHAPSPTPRVAGERHVYHAELGPEAGFLAPVAHTNVSYVLDALSSLRLEPRATGLFVVSSFNATASIEFHSADSTEQVFSHAPNAVLAPQGGCTARSSDEAGLEIHAPEGGEPLAAQGGCAHLLGWSSAGDRLACISDDPGFGGLRILDFDAARRRLTPSLVEGAYVYSEETSQLRRRAFSPMGRRFAFSTDDSLFVAERGDERWLVERAPTAFFDTDNPFVDLAFSPDERWLLMHRGNTLMLRDLDAEGDETAVIEIALPASEPCAEVEGDTSHRWCGDGSSRSAAMAWSPDSKALAYRALESGSLPALDSSVGAGGVVLLRCGPGCTHYAFQP